jgi:C4-dicarboxylate transporter DctM subunit
MINLVLFGSFFLLLILNVPIAYCLGLSSIFALLYANIPLSVVATNLYTGTSKFLLLAIPFFVLAGNIMAKAGISDRLISFADAGVGHKKGGFAVVTVIVACFFGAVSGSGPATVAALGSILLPAMIDKDGFDAPFSAGLLASASSIAIVIPPSIAFIVYASIVGVSVGDIFMAGIIPGILMGVALVKAVKIECRRKKIQSKRQKASGKDIWKAFLSAFWAFLMPVIILGGIYGGIFTPTEAAAVSVFYGLIVGFFIYRTLKLKDLFSIFVDSAKTSGSILLIIACAALFSYVCSTQGISKAAQALLTQVASNKFIFLAIINVIFLIAGCFVDANSAMYIFIPIMFPVARSSALTWFSSASSPP